MVCFDYDDGEIESCSHLMLVNQVPSHIQDLSAKHKVHV